MSPDGTIIYEKDQIGRRNVLRDVIIVIETVLDLTDINTIA